MDVYLVSSRRLDLGRPSVYDTQAVCSDLESARIKAKELCSDLMGSFVQTSPGSWEYDVGGDHPVRVVKFNVEGPAADLGIAELCQISSKIALEHGWQNDFQTQSLLAITEIAEAVEEFRNHRGPDEIWYSKTTKSEDGKVTTITEVSSDTPGAKPEGIPVEFADAVIRMCDWCGQKGVNLLRAIKIKMEYNRTRPFRHGGRRI